ncbi:EH signature domain-containing protein [Zobellella denitrificans]
MTRASQMESESGRNDTFEQMVVLLRNIASTGRFDSLPQLLKRRVTARALSWLWLNNDNLGNRLLNPRLLETLIKAQAPRLTRITLQQLAQLYFRRFDQLNEREGLRELLEYILLEQLKKLPAPKIENLRTDPLQTLKEQGYWLLTLQGPRQLVEQVQEQGSELGETFNALGLQGFDDGRYGDICRAHFYLETLRNLSVGKWASVMDELLKPSVSKAPFEGNRRIGHAALEILIDRAGQEPGDTWQNFILNLAGDPRIARTASNYREWWQPLGEERIQKVRGWLSKEDLRLFLQAVEQYGIESGKQDLQRMFPARKRFLEGLFRLKLIRHTRLLLGSKARLSVRRILGKEVQTSFASMDGQMSDKAVIYLDCGDFHLVEGSHSFKIWVYLAPPSDNLRSYERNSFTYHELTKNIPVKYRNQYPGLPYDAITHQPHIWQNKVFVFLANNGIGLDIEQLLDERDYNIQLRRYGIPMVKGSPPKIHTAQPQEPPQASAPSSPRLTMTEERSEYGKEVPNSNRKDLAERSNGGTPAIECKPATGSLSASLLKHVQSRHAKTPASQSWDQKKSEQSHVQDKHHGPTPAEHKQASGALPTDLLKRLRSTHGSDSGLSMKEPSNVTSLKQTESLKPEELSPLHEAILNYLKGKPSCNIHELAAATSLQGGTIQKVTTALNEEMAPYVRSNSQSYWSLSREGTLAWQNLFSNSHETVIRAKQQSEKEAVQQRTEEEAPRSYSAATELEVKNLSPVSLKILDYFSANSGDRARSAAKVMGMDTSQINQQLYGPLKNMLIKDTDHGWHLTPTVRQIRKQMEPKK